MQPRDPQFESKVRTIFAEAPFVNGNVGIALVEVGPGWCASELALLPKHRQQNGFAHAGVLATMGDHTAGGAAASLVAADEGVLTVEFKINLLRPGVGERAHCRATVLKAGRTITVVESEVHVDDKLVVKMTVTLAVVRER